jgi:hypothetical protein
VSGAQPSEMMLAALQQAWTAAHPLQMVGAGDGDTTCTDESCAV